MKNRYRVPRILQNSRGSGLSRGEEISFHLFGRGSGCRRLSLRGGFLLLRRGRLLARRQAFNPHALAVEMLEDTAEEVALLEDPGGNC